MKSIIILAACLLLVSGEKSKKLVKAKLPEKSTQDLDTQEARPSYNTYPAPPKNEYGLVHDYPHSGYGKVEDQHQSGGYRKGVEASSGYGGGYGGGYDNRGPLLPSAYGKSKGPYASGGSDAHPDSYEKPVGGYGEPPSSYSKPVSGYGGSYSGPSSSLSGGYSKPVSGYSSHSKYGS
ncbi:unnamed protein product, partial [Larinioides sclopetarius]